MGALVSNVSAKTFENKVLNAAQPVVVDVWAPWCKPCLAMAPEFEAAAEKLDGQALFLKLNADKNQDLVKEFKIMGIPTLLVFNHGKLVDRKTGLTNQATIVKRVAPILSMDADKAARSEITGLLTPKTIRMLWLAGAVLVLGLGAWIAYANFM